MIRILLVEDEIKVARAVRDGLAAEGYDVHLAPTGDQGLAALRSDAFDLLVLDLMVPGADGLEVLSRVMVVADRAVLRQAVINLLDNAIKFSADGATVRMAARQAAAQSILEVVDEGPGIEPRDLPYIFDRFYRADPSRSRNLRGGAGLGLSIARWAVEANGGRLEVESEPSRGSVFRIVLPAANG